MMIIVQCLISHPLVRPPDLADPLARNSEHGITNAVRL